MVAAGRALVVLDFDWTVIEENSDTWVIDAIGAKHIYSRLRAQGLPWTQLMDATLEQAASDLGTTRRDIEAALHRIPLQPEILDAIWALHASQSADVVLVSDANSLYISCVLRAHGLDACVREVHTNPAEFDAATGALRVRPYHAVPPVCSRRGCAANLCKGSVVRALLAAEGQQAERYARVVFAGDGGGDFCACAELLEVAAAGEVERERGGAPLLREAVLLARERYPNGAPCALAALLHEHAGGGGGAVRLWSTPQELAQELRRLLV